MFQTDWLILRVLNISLCLFSVKLTVTEGKNILCINREIMHLCQVNKSISYVVQHIVTQSSCTDRDKAGLSKRSVV